MSVETRLAVAGLVVGVVMALGGTAITLLWPDKRWIGWLCLSGAGSLLVIWLAFEIRHWFGASWISLGFAVGVGALIGGGIGGIVWKGTRVSADISPTQKELRFAVEDHHATIRVTVNGSHYWTGLAFLDTGSFEKGWEIKDWPVRVYTKPNDTLPLVDTKVYSSELGLAEIKANRLVIVPQGWDTNANDRAL